MKVGRVILVNKQVLFFMQYKNMHNKFYIKSHFTLRQKTKVNLDSGMKYCIGSPIICKSYKEVSFLLHFGTDINIDYHLFKLGT